MAALTASTPGRATGSDLSTASGLTSAAAGGDTFAPGDDVYLRVKCTSANTITVTVTPSSGAGPRGTTVAPLALAPTVAASTGDRIYGPFPANPFASVSDGQVHVSYSTVTNVTVQVLKFSAS